jgi:hypothetical protein
MHGAALLRRHHQPIVGIGTRGIVPAGCRFARLQPIFFSRLSRSFHSFQGWLLLSLSSCFFNKPHKATDNHQCLSVAHQSHSRSSACLRPAPTPQFTNGIIDRPSCRPIPSVPLPPLVQRSSMRGCTAVCPIQASKKRHATSLPSRGNPVITCLYMYHYSVIRAGGAGRGNGAAAHLGSIGRFMQRVRAASQPSD